VRRRPADPSPIDGRSAPTPGVVERRVARVVLVDESGSVLLLSARDPGEPDRGAFWLTPGGGVDDGESLAAAARREVYEESGHRLGDLGPVVWERDAAFSFEGRHYRQHESFFVVRTRRFEMRPAALTELEVRSTTGWQWYPVDELAQRAHTVFPEDLASRVAQWARDRGGS
jgi:8-oxo-dGTP pyrophosphatase MutT (NUDIX family)